MAEYRLPKPTTRVRFPSSAPLQDQTLLRTALIAYNISMPSSTAYPSSLSVRYLTVFYTVTLNAYAIRHLLRKYAIPTRHPLHSKIRPCCALQQLKSYFAIYKYLEFMTTSLTKL